jgi:hypothetical protein
MIPASRLFDQSTMAALLEHDPVVQDYREKLRTLDQVLLQDLLHATVTALQAEIPGLGETVAFDVKHIYASVKENNSRVYIKERYKPDQHLAGDPDCKLGVKRSTSFPCMWRLMPPSTTGTSMRRWPTDRGLLPSHSIGMGMKKCSATLMAPHVARGGLRMHPTYQFQHTNGYRA